MQIFNGSRLRLQFDVLFIPAVDDNSENEVTKTHSEHVKILCDPHQKIAGILTRVLSVDSAASAAKLAVELNEPVKPAKQILIYTRARGIFKSEQLCDGPTHRRKVLECTLYLSWSVLVSSSSASSFVFDLWRLSICSCRDLKTTEQDTRYSGSSRISGVADSAYFGE